MAVTRPSRLEWLPQADSWSLTSRFAAVGGLVVLVAGISLAYFQRETAIDQLARMGEENNVALTHAFGNSTWPRFSEFLVQAGNLPAEDVRRHPRTQELHDAVAQLMAGTTVVKVKLYHLNGITVYSTDPKQIGGDYGQNPRFLKALRDQSAGELEFREAFSAFSGRLTDRYVLSSYVPVRRDGSAAIEGVAEIYNDVTKFHDDATRRGYVQAAGVAAWMLVVYALLLLFVWRIDLRVRLQHRREIELSANVAKAEASSRSKSEFLANMSHELRTPLNAIIGFSDMIQKEQMGPLGTSIYGEYAQAIGKSGRHLLETFNNVLNLARADAGQITIDRETANVVEILREAAALMQHEAAAKKIQLRFVSDGGEIPVETDIAKIRQIAINLVSNALKFTPEGGSVRVEVAKVSSRDAFTVRIADTGIGMRAVDIPFALAPFCQIDNGIARRFDGVGLGLPLSKSFAEVLGGTLSIESAPNQGTSVTVELPCRVPANEAVSRPAWIRHAA